MPEIDEDRQGPEAPDNTNTNVATIKVIVFLAILMALISGSMGWFAHDSLRTPPTGAELLGIENARAAKAQADAQAAFQKRIADLQEVIIRQCEEKGNIPGFLGGNVDCHPAPPAASGTRGMVWPAK